MSLRNLSITTCIGIIWIWSIFFRCIRIFWIFFRSIWIRLFFWSIWIWNFLFIQRWRFVLILLRLRERLFWFFFVQSKLFFLCHDLKVSKNYALKIERQVLFAMMGFTHDLRFRGTVMGKFETVSGARKMKCLKKVQFEF